MPCQAKSFECHLRRVYIGQGNPYYHGEMCTGCRWWLNTQTDILSKERAGLILPPPARLLYGRPR